MEAKILIRTTIQITAIEIYIQNPVIKRPILIMLYGYTPPAPPANYTL